MTGRSLHPGDSSWRFAPTAYVPSQKTVTQPYWPPQLDHGPNPTSLGHPERGQLNEKGHNHHPNHFFGSRAAQPLSKVQSGGNRG